MNKSISNASLCDCITDCIDKTDIVREISKVKPRTFNAKERQFFLLLPNNDFLNKKVKTNLASKVDLKGFFRDGLVKQTKECMNFDQLLLQNISQRKKSHIASQVKLQKAPDPLLQVLAQF